MKFGENKSKKIVFTIFIGIVIIFIIGISSNYLFENTTILSNVIYQQDYESLFQEARNEFWMGNYDQHEELHKKLIKIDKTKYETYVYLFWQYYSTSFKNDTKVKLILEECIQNTVESDICKSFKLFTLVQTDNFNDFEIIFDEKNKIDDISEIDIISLIIYYDKLDNGSKANEYLELYLNSNITLSEEIKHFSLWIFYPLSDYILDESKNIDVEYFFSTVINSSNNNFNSLFKIDAKQYLARYYKEIGEYQKAEDLLKDFKTRNNTEIV